MAEEKLSKVIWSDLRTDQYQLQQIMQDLEAKFNPQAWVSESYPWYHYLRLFDYQLRMMQQRATLLRETLDKEGRDG